jgi:hypothetical protein
MMERIVFFMCSEISNGLTLFSQELQPSLSPQVLQQLDKKVGLAIFSIYPSILIYYFYSLFFVFLYPFLIPLPASLVQQKKAALKTALIFNSSYPLIE